MNSSIFCSIMPREEIIDELRRLNAETVATLKDAVKELQREVLTIRLDIAFWKGKQAAVAFFFGGVGSGLTILILKYVLNL